MPLARSVTSGSAQDSAKIGIRVCLEGGKRRRRGDTSIVAEERSRTSRVLVAEGERELAGVFSSCLVSADYSVTQACTGPDAVSATAADDPDVLVLALALPGMDGVEVCRRIRTFSDCYIILLAAEGDDLARLAGLRAGADDCLTKPFGSRELVARVQAVLRRPRTLQSTPASKGGVDAPRSFGQLRIDPAGRGVWVGTESVDLTATEFDILDVISAQPRRALSRHHIIDRVWGEAAGGRDVHIVDVHVANLRRKLGDSAQDPQYVATVRGVGYRMELG